MTTTSPLSASVLPDSMQVSSPNEYQVANLTLTVTNNSAAPYNLANGLTIVIPVDPGGSGSQSALVLSSASGTAGGQAQPTPTVPITPGVAAGTNWTAPEETAPGTYRTLPNDSGMLAAGGSVVFTFSSVVADLVAGKANITVNVPPATTGLTLEAQITKLPAALSATFVAESPLLTMPDNTTELTWQVLGAESCTLTWLPASTAVTYNNEQYYGTWNDPPFQFNSGAPLPVATLYQATSFLLTATGQGEDFTATQAVALATPRLAALTMPPVVNGTAPAGGGPAGTPMVTGVEQSGAGDPDGGQPVTITGTGFTGATSVAFGTASTAEVTVDATGSTITVAAPPVAPADITASSPGTVVDVTVTVGGDTTSPVTSAVNPADKYTYANPATLVAPYQQFELVWSCFDGTVPALNWTVSSSVNDPSITDVVTVTGAASGPVSNGGPIAISDTAVVTITAPTTFSLTVAAAGSPLPSPVSVGLDAVALTAFSANQTEAPATGDQSVSFTWTAHNATGFTLTGGGLPLIPLGPNVSSYPPIALPMTGPSTYTLTADGFNAAGAYAPVSSSETVTPLAVELTSFLVDGTSAVTIRAGQSVTLSWNATDATGFTLSPGGYEGASTTQVTVTPIGDTTYTLTALGYSPTGQLPSASVTVDIKVVKPHKEHLPKENQPKEGNALLEKNPNPLERPFTVTPPGAVPGPGDLAEPDPAPPGGTEQAFIGTDERPDVGQPGPAGSDPPAAGEA